MKKQYIYIFGLILLLFLGYNSVYFKKLSALNTFKTTNTNFKVYADSLYYKGIINSKKTIDLAYLLTLVKSNPELAFKKHGNRLGIGNSAYFMVKGTGKIIAINDGIYTISDPKNGTILIDTKYIFGNALRDASGLVKLTDFKTNDDFNKVSEAINTLVREKIIPKAIQKLKNDDLISYTGAIKLSKKQKIFLDLLVIPSQITLQ